MSLVKEGLGLVVEPSSLVVERAEEWTTTKKVVNHKTKQTETRVQRQIVMEDGKVIADSGPQITTQTKEDNKQEETESTNKKGSGNDLDLSSHGYIRVPGSAQVISEKTETHNTTREAKQEQMQYHDEDMRELSGYDVHKKALVAPNELISIREGLESSPKGKMTHYSSKSRKTTDREEVRELSKQHRDGNVTTETTRTMHHEEVDDDEVPDDHVVPGALPEAYSETSRNVEFHKNYDDDDEYLQKSNKKLVALEMERHHNTESLSRHSMVDDEKVHKSTTNNWVDYHFGSESDSFSGSGGSDEVVHKSRTRAGGNVINIEMESHRRSPRDLSERYERSPRDLSDNYRRSIVDEAFTSRNYSQTGQHTHVKKRDSSLGSSPSPPRTPMMRIHQEAYHSHTSSPRSSPRPRTVSPGYDARTYNSSSHDTRTFGNHLISRSSPRPRPASPGCDSKTYGSVTHDSRTYGNSTTRQHKIERDNEKKDDNYYSSSRRRQVRDTGTETHSPTSGTGSYKCTTPSKTFHFGDETDVGYHRSLAKEDNQRQRQRQRHSPSSTSRNSYKSKEKYHSVRLD